MKNKADKEIIGIFICILMIIFAAFSSSATIRISELNNNGKEYVYELDSEIIILGRNTISVDNEGDGDYSSIQDAIDNATDGDIIEVYSGEYQEKLVVNKQISLIGLDYELGSGDDTGKPIIDGIPTYTVIRINHDNCMVKGFKIMNGNRGIHISYASNCTISGNLMSNNNDYGILLDHGSKTIMIGASYAHLSLIISLCITTYLGFSYFLVLIIISQIILYQMEYGCQVLTIL